MKVLLETIAKALVDYPEDVLVKESFNRGCVLLELSVNDADMGKVIGKRGKVAKAIRSVLKAYANRSNQKVNVEIVQ